MTRTVEFAHRDHQLKPRTAHVHYMGAFHRQHQCNVSQHCTSPCGQCVLFWDFWITPDLRRPKPNWMQVFPSSFTIKILLLRCCSWVRGYNCVVIITKSCLSRYQGHKAFSAAHAGGWSHTGVKRVPDRRMSHSGIPGYVAPRLRLKGDFPPS